ncbi:MAG: beta-hydroxyacyl-ACP dehydratase [Gemmataceae bacterium]|nr:beta-hydroxyacyl-ACP dehydratase [Gemmataceae bacterium]
MPAPPLFDLALLDFTKIVADKEEIRRYNPQRFEIEQVDAIVYMDPTRHIVIGYKDLKADEFWTKGHMPGFPLLPGVLICEAAAQVASYYIRKHNLMGGDFLGFGGMDKVRFRAPVKPGDRLVLVGQGIKVHRRQTISRFQGFVGATMVFEADIIGVAMAKKGEE